MAKDGEGVILDCHTRDSTLTSLSKIYGVPAADLDAFLRIVDLEIYYETHYPLRDPDETITALLEGEIRRQPFALTQVNWFHLTRVRKTETFSQGLLPLHAVLDHVWDVLFAIFQGSEHELNLRTLTRYEVPNFQYKLKAGDRMHGGPYAMLVRDAAFRSAEIGNHDYLGLPEIIEDICLGYHERYGVSITDKVANALTPCMVKFKSTRELGRPCLEAAVYYVYLTGRGHPLSFHSNTCFDGRSSTIPLKDIISIEFLSP